MLSNDVLLQLTDDRRREREVSAENERLAVQARGLRRRRRALVEAGRPGSGLLQLLAARHHATS